MSISSHSNDHEDYDPNETFNHSKLLRNSRKFTHQKKLRYLYKFQDAIMQNIQQLLQKTEPQIFNPYESSSMERQTIKLYHNEEEINEINQPNRDLLESIYLSELNQPWSRINPSRFYQDDQGEEQKAQNINEDKKSQCILPKVEFCEDKSSTLSKNNDFYETKETNIQRDSLDESPPANLMKKLSQSKKDPIIHKTTLPNKEIKYLSDQYTLTKKVSNEK